MKEKENLTDIQNEPTPTDAHAVCEELAEPISDEKDIASASAPEQLNEIEKSEGGALPNEEGGQDCAGADIYEYLCDLEVLAEKFPEMMGESDLSSLKNPLRYAALRDLGVSAEEAYLATSGKSGVVRDNRTHLGGSVPRAAAVPKSAMSSRELREAREIFGDIGDGELIRLYRRVTSTL